MKFGQHLQKQDHYIKQLKDSKSHCGLCFFGLFGESDARQVINLIIKWQTDGEFFQRYCVARDNDTL